MDQLIENLKVHLRFYRYTDVEHQSVTVLAKYCRVTRKTIYNWLNGRTKIATPKLRLIKEWLEQRKDLTGQKSSDIMPPDSQKGLKMMPVLFLSCITQLVAQYISCRRRNDVNNRRLFCFNPVIFS